MHSLLKEIIAEKRREISRLRRSGTSVGRGEPPSPMRDFEGGISRDRRIGLIAEIKFASPSAGTISDNSDPVLIGRIYEKSGAAALSLITDQGFFKGDIRELPRLKEEVSLPILRKDFLLDPVQVEESYLHGADAVLIIARLLGLSQLEEMLAACGDLGLAPLTEVHDRDDLEKALLCGARIIGINNRDLDTFSVSLRTTFDLVPFIPASCLVVSESGIVGPRDIRRLKEASVDAVLVGTSLMKSDDIAASARALVKAGGDHGEG
ncbi:MAG: indole-3-glycerol phosphate synthase TrpC [Deltaproteobacteria bacterium]|nr:indole-3-glycerol phosphate synthase TrpC [Deltaproteobacteria bacterium]HDZ91711.1 indole-3-glycerol phosphate synthase TrpC [Deltaproteobacteria bacterium]